MTESFTTVASSASESASIRVDVFADVICPWCYIERAPRRGGDRILPSTPKAHRPVSACARV